MTQAASLLVALARTAPLCALAPPVGGGSRLVRALLAVALAALILPSLRLDPATPLLPLLLRELAMGLALGLVSSIPFRAAEAAGALVDQARRTDGDDTGIFARLDGALALALFAAVGGPSLWFAALVDSYTLLPVGSLPHAAAGIGLAIDAVGHLIVLAVALASPVLAAALLADVLTSLVRRAVPELRVAATGRAGAAATPRQLAILVAAAGSALALSTALGGAFGGLGAALRDAARALLH